MTLFTHGTRKAQRSRKPKRSILSSLKGLLRRSNPSASSGDGQVSLGHKLGVMFARSMIVLVLGVSWWVAAPWLFLVLLPSFQLYNQWIINYHTNIFDVYQLWQVLPEVLLFTLAPLWTGGILELLLHDAPLEKIF
jgi:hypothetical protein